MAYQKLILLSIFFAAIGACSYPEKITDGKTAYDRRQYAVAIDMLPKEYNKAKNRTEKAAIAYMLGESFRRNNKPKEAAEWYQKAADDRYGKDEQLQVARMNQYQEQYDAASQAYKSAGQQLGDVNYYREQMQACKSAKTWLAQKDSTGYKLESLVLNTKDNDFAPALYANDTLVFSSDRKSEKDKKNYKWTDKPFFDLYASTGTKSEARQWAAGFNQKFHQGTPNFNKDYTEVFYCNCGSDANEPIDYCQIWTAKKEGNKWAEPTQVKLGEPQANFMHPFLVELDNGGRLLYFASNSKQGYGGYDLYSSVWLVAEQKWAVPRNLGSAINSKYNEAFPFVEQDTLYFSSDGWAGMGGLDIFKAEKSANSGAWKNVQNLRAPMNSGGDDFGIIVQPNPNPADTMVLKVGFVTSNRQGGRGGDDIYSFVKKRIITAPPADTPKIVDTLPKKPQFVIRLEGVVKEKRYKNPNNPNSEVDGLQPLLAASVQTSNEDTVFTFGVEDEGVFNLNLTANKVYTFRASKEGYFNQDKSISTQGIIIDSLKADTVIRVELVLEKIFANQEIVLENIYYDYDKANIRDDAKPTLDELASVLKKNPQIKIQLASHTDCRGAADYNQKLSQRRAESAVLYLTEKGIAQEKMTAKGYGEASPSTTCKCETCSEDEHQKNRRTTFMVLE